MQERVRGSIYTGAAAKKVIQRIPGFIGEKSSANCPVQIDGLQRASV